MTERNYIQFARFLMWQKEDHEGAIEELNARMERPEAEPLVQLDREYRRLVAELGEAEPDSYEAAHLIDRMEALEAEIQAVLREAA